MFGFATLFMNSLIFSNIFPIFEIILFIQLVQSLVTLQAKHFYLILFDSAVQYRYFAKKCIH